MKKRIIIFSTIFVILNPTLLINLMQMIEITFAVLEIFFSIENKINTQLKRTNQHPFCFLAAFSIHT